MKRSIFKEDRKYTFRDYFEMKHPIDEIVGEFGYSFSIEAIDLPKSMDYDPAIVQNLNRTYYAIFPKIALTSEAAKREFLVAPLLLEIAKSTSVKVNVEYPLEVNEKLSGLLDYFLKASQNLVVIEAKKQNIDAGFNQLAAELIALDKYEESESTNTLYGAVTLGDIWKFGTLDRDRKHIAKNIPSQTIPRDTEETFAILMGILNKA